MSRKLKTAAKLMAGIVLGAAIGVGIGMLTDEPGVDPAKSALKERFGLWLVLFAIVLAIFFALFAIAVHELGHVTGGKLAGFRFHFLIVGPLRVDRDDRDRLRVGWNRQIMLAGGIAAMLPTDTVDLKRRLFLMIAGGPAASLLLGAMVFAPNELVHILGIMSLGIFVVTMIPAKGGGFSTDGRRMLRLLSKGPNAVREAAQLPLMGLAASGTPPREWPADLVGAAIGIADGSMDEYTGHVFAYYRSADLVDIGGARLHMQRALELVEKLPPAFRPVLYVEAAYFKARHDQDAAAAHSLLAGVPPKALGVKGHEIARARAAIELAEGKVGEARRIAAEALTQTPARDPFTRGCLQEILSLTA